ncbi:MAG: 2OG-Fe(II) oxygenase [Gammaproteobacteria bacterium]|nr:MAG: 2OG-Fe(II) oxygenase [Gammaproteobacteria bacterium]
MFSSAPHGSILDLRNYVQWFDGALTPEFCAQMVSAFEQMTTHQVRNGQGVQAALTNSAWTELNIQPHVDQAFLGFFYTQIDKYLAEYNARLPMGLPVPSRPHLEDLRMKHAKQEGFQPHFDAGDQHANRYMVFLWYLNDVAEGGETRFPDLGIEVQARAGRLLMFPPYWMFQHAGLAPLMNDKYIVSTYMLFQTP